MATTTTLATLAEAFSQRSPYRGMVLMVSTGTVLTFYDWYSDLLDPSGPKFYFALTFLAGTVMTATHYLTKWRAEAARKRQRPLMVWRKCLPLMEEVLSTLSRLESRELLDGNEGERERVISLLLSMGDYLDQIDVKHPPPLLTHKSPWEGLLRHLIKLCELGDPESLERAQENTPWARALATLGDE